MLRPFLLAVFLVFTGCAALSQAQKDMVACSKDPVCSEDAQSKAQMWKQVVSVFNPIAGAGVGSGMLAFGYWLGGRKKQKEMVK